MNRLPIHQGFLDRCLKPLLSGSASGDPHRSRFPAGPAVGEDRFRLGRCGDVPSVRRGREPSPFSRLFGAGGSVSRGRVRHFHDGNFGPVRRSRFSPIGDTRRQASLRRGQVREAVNSGWRILLHVLLRR